MSDSKEMLALINERMSALSKAPEEGGDESSLGDTGGKAKSQAQYVQSRLKKVNKRLANASSPKEKQTLLLKVLKETFVSTYKMIKDEESLKRDVSNARKGKESASGLAKQLNMQKKELQLEMAHKDIKAHEDMKKTQAIMKNYEAMQEAREELDNARSADMTELYQRLTSFDEHRGKLEAQIEIQKKQAGLQDKINALEVQQACTLQAKAEQAHAALLEKHVAVMQENNQLQQSMVAHQESMEKTKQAINDNVAMFQGLDKSLKESVQARNKLQQEQYKSKQEHARKDKLIIEMYESAAKLTAENAQLKQLSKQLLKKANST
jgi:hypothetical protein